MLVWLILECVVGVGEEVLVGVGCSTLWQLVWLLLVGMDFVDDGDWSRGWWPVPPLG